MSGLPPASDPRGRKQAECRVYLVGHDGSPAIFATPASSPREAAVAYVVALGTPGSIVQEWGAAPLDQLVRVWVKDHDQSRGRPLSHDSTESITRWATEGPERSMLLQAAIDSLHPVIDPKRLAS